MYLLYSYSTRLELNPYCTTPGKTVGDTADYAFCILFGICAILVYNFYLNSLNHLQYHNMY